MEEYEVKITNEALADMEKIYEYIAFELMAPENAINQYNRIADAILSLHSFPNRNILFEMEPEHSLGMRRMIVDNFLICYMVDPGIVTVTDVLYCASNVHIRLSERHLENDNK